MRLWSLHPCYLDSKGLLALWREALLAQAVLLGETKGYRQHPQLLRFRDSADPAATIATYLWAVHAEAQTRGYHFDASKIRRPKGRRRLKVTREQLAYELRHLLSKLVTRDPVCGQSLHGISDPPPHPLFHVIPGPVEPWEKQKD